MKKHRYPNKGMEIHEITPIILGGSPTDPSNKVLIPREEYGAIVTYWNNILKQVLKEERRDYPIINDKSEKMNDSVTFNDIKPLLKDLELNSPASLEKILSLEKDLGIKLPDQYIEFMMNSNGAEGMIGNSYLVLWTIEEIIPYNNSYSVPEFAPGIIVFGSNGAGEAYGFDVRQGNQIVMMPFIGLTNIEITKLANSFFGFLKHLAGE
ncbi:MAG TPA: SMI1/KNR4 family protein [Bacteroidales bacterium]|nr:SMI1/KNR4 family protein [Bacteroidales bacterium]